MKLYWVTTADHHEDWFIVASSKQKAEKFHEENEGYEYGHANAQKVINITDNMITETSYPSEELLLSTGANFISKDEPRIVVIDGRRFVEGMLNAHIRELDDNLFEQLGKERLNQTIRTDTTKH